jgi:integrase
MAKRTNRRTRGEGSITKRKDGRWMARYWITMPDGTRKRQHIIGKSYEVVLEKLREEQVASQRGMPQIRSTRTTAEYVNWWLSEVGPHQIRPSTMSIYRGQARVYIIPLIGNIPLTQLKPEHVRTMMNQMLARGKSNYLAGKVRNALSSMLTTALKMEFVHRNVAQLVDPPAHKAKERHTWTKEQVTLFLDSIRGHNYYPIFLIMFCYGLRKGEAIGLRWQDIDFEKDVIHIRQNLVMTADHEIYIGEPKTEASIRDLPLMPIVKEALLKLRKEPVHPDVKDDLVFHTKIGTPIDGHTLLRLFGDLAYKLGLPRLTLHEIRHTVTSILINDLQVPPKEAQAILGHASIVTTLQFYTHVDDSHKAGAVASLADSLTPAM